MRHNHIKVEYMQLCVDAVVLVVCILILIPCKIQALQTLWIEGTQVSKHDADKYYPSVKHWILLDEAELLTELVRGEVHDGGDAPKAHDVSDLLLDVQLVMLDLRQLLIQQVKIGYFQPVDEQKDRLSNCDAVLLVVGDSMFSCMVELDGEVQAEIWPIYWHDH